MPRAPLMTTQDFIIDLFCRIDDIMKPIPKHQQAKLYPSEVVTLAVLFALKGVSGRAFYRWVRGNWLDLFPRLPERTRLSRLFKTHQGWAKHFWGPPTILGWPIPMGSS